MDNLTDEEKKSLIIKIVISVVLLIAMIIIGLVLTFGVSISNRLRGDVTGAEVDAKASATCDNLIQENYGFVQLGGKYLDEALSMLPITLELVDKETNTAYKKVLTLDECDPTYEYYTFKIPVGTYDIKITKPGYLYVFYENRSIVNSGTNYLYISNLIPGDINGDGYINDEDLNDFDSYRNKTCSSLSGDEALICDAVDMNDDGVVNSEDYTLLEQNVGRVYAWYKNGSLYTGQYIIDQDDFELTYGQTMQLTYHKTDYFNQSYTSNWRSSNTRVATVEDGVVTPVSVGTAEISFGNSEPVTVTVSEKGSIILEESDITMDGITEKQIKYSYSDDNTFNGAKPTFTSSNTSIITVDENGVIKSLKAGTAKVTVKAGFNTTATVNVTVNDVEAEDFTINEKSIVFNGYEKKQIDITPIPSNATIYKYSYEVVDDEYASVTTDGVVTSKKSGSTRVKVTLTQGEKEISRYVDIEINYVPTESISYEENVSFDGATTRNISVTYYPANGLDREIVATSDDVYGDTNNKILSSISTSEGNVRVTSAYPGEATINLVIDREQGEDLTGTITANVSDVAVTRLSVPSSTFGTLSYFISVTISPYPSNYTKNHYVGGYSIYSGESNSFAQATLSGSTLTVRRRAAQYSGSLTVCVRSEAGYTGCGTYSK